MPQLKEILEKESLRTTTEQCATAHLFREGTFYRAYEWSAWLYARCFPDLKVTHRVMKGGDDITFVGFPLTSIDRFTPEGATLVDVGDGNVDSLLPTDVLPTDGDAAQLLVDFENWKRSQPVAEATKRRQVAERSEAERNAHPRLTDIMLRLMAYPIEQHSPMECMAFLSETKRQLSEIL